MTHIQVCRRIQVCIGKIFSSEQTLLSGAPQGNASSPILFNITISDLDLLTVLITIHRIEMNKILNF